MQRHPREVLRFCFAFLIAGYVSGAQAEQDPLAAHALAARQAQQRGDYKTAAAEWEAITHLEPKLAEAYSNLGLTWHFAREYPRAIDALLHASKLNPSLVAPHLFLGIDYYLTARAKDAIPQLKRALELSPGNAIAQKWLGMCFFQEGHYEASVHELTSASNASPRDTDLFFHISRAYSKLLYQSFDEITRLDPGSPYLKALSGANIPLPNPGLDLMPALDAFKGGRAEDAFTLLSVRVHQSPKNTENWYWFGKSAEALGLAWLDRFLAASPGSYRAMQLRAEYFLAVGNEVEASREYRKALSVKPDAIQIHESLGNIYMEHHQYAKAIPEYEAELRVNPYALLSLDRIGQAYAELREPEKALPYLNRALNIDPRSFEAVQAMGKICFDRGDYKSAIKNYRIAIDVKGGAEPAVLFKLSQSYRRLGERAQAEQWLVRFRAALEKQHASEERKLTRAEKEAATPR